jgi:transcriptional regulator GlxA family with amidase domain
MWEDAPSRVVFTAPQPSSPELAGYWDAVLRHVHDDVLADDALIGDPLVVADVAQRLAAAVLTVFPNTARDRDHAEPHWTGPAVLRRAMEFMDEHAHEPISIDDVAAAARVGPRALQQAFRRHRGTTPLEYLREVRMERAHRDLTDADPTRGDTVAAAAARWGFPHAGRFSVQYRERYGRSPRTTLRS